MYRFLHTSDWQIGMKAAGLGAASGKVRQFRLDAIRNLLEIARDQQAAAVIVAGDIFEDNQVSTTLVEQVAGILNDADACPIYLLPGNHDPFTLGSVWHRDVWRQLRPHVRLLTDHQPIELAAGVSLFPCPLLAKHGTDDPTARIPPRPPSDKTLRIAVAHGTMRIRPDVGDDDFPIALDAAERADVDYLALGHWHSVLAGGGGRAWYSGTHETTKFGERDSGQALLVTLTDAGRPPGVEAVRTGVLKWAEESVDLESDTADAVVRRFREWPDAANQLLRLICTGRATPATAAAIEQLRGVLAERFLYADCDTAHLRPEDAAEALTDLNGSPYLIAAADELRQLAEAPPGGTADPAVAARALDLLHQFAWAGRA
ncbi:MAG: DNA repair exonuclease [Tepidisphaeraceae bacterium]